MRWGSSAGCCTAPRRCPGRCRSGGATVDAWPRNGLAPLKTATDRPTNRSSIGSSAATDASGAEWQAVAAGLAETAGPAVLRWRAEVDDYLPLIARVISQTQRRVFDGEAVPAGEKLVSLFEPHADIILKGGRQVQY